MKIIEAAGAVVTRRRDDHAAPEVLIIHRPQYDDWSLPKGKLENGETPPVAAVREVAEETRVRITLHSPLDRTDYPTSKGDKTISWWCGATDGDAAEPAAPEGDEVDQALWLPMAQAADRVSYDHDRQLLAQAAEQPVTTPVLVVRHAKALSRRAWNGGESDRPLRQRGKKQARQLVALLDAYGVQELVSSPWRRCSTTLLPYALRSGRAMTTEQVLTEDAGADDAEAVAEAVQEISERAVVDHRPAVICSHRPVLPHVLTALDIPDRPLATAECVVAHLTDTGDLHAIEYHRPRA